MPQLAHQTRNPRRMHPNLQHDARRLLHREEARQHLAIGGDARLEHHGPRCVDPTDPACAVAEIQSDRYLRKKHCLR